MHYYFSLSLSEQSLLLQEVSNYFLVLCNYLFDVINIRKNFIYSITQIIWEVSLVIFFPCKFPRKVEIFSLDQFLHYYNVLANIQNKELNHTIKKIKHPPCFNFLDFKLFRKVIPSCATTTCDQVSAGKSFFLREY